MRPSANAYCRTSYSAAPTSPSTRPRGRPHCKRVKKCPAADRVPYYVSKTWTKARKASSASNCCRTGRKSSQRSCQYADGTHDVNPSDETLASRIGLTVEAEGSAYDLVIVVAGRRGWRPPSCRPEKALTPSLSTPVLWGAPALATRSITIRGSLKEFREPAG